MLHDCFFFFQAEDGIRDLVRSRGLGDVYKRQDLNLPLVSIIDTEGAALSKEAEEGGLAGEIARSLSLIHI